MYYRKGYWTVYYTGTQSLITTLSNSLILFILVRRILRNSTLLNIKFYFFLMQKKLRIVPPTPHKTL